MPQPLSIVVKFFMGHPLLSLCFWLRTTGFFVWDGRRADDSDSGQTYEHRRGGWNNLCCFCLQYLSQIARLAYLRLRRDE
jgi:hypothetical protein